MEGATIIAGVVKSPAEGYKTKVEAKGKSEALAMIFVSMLEDEKMRGIMLEALDIYYKGNYKRRD